MANSSNQIELVVTVEVDKANRSIKTVNANLSSIEQTAVNAARGASHGIDGLTASMAKGATAGHLFADAIEKALEFAKEWTIEAAKEAAQADRATAVMRGLAMAHGDGAAAAERAVEAIQEVGYTAADATTSVQKLIIADIGLDKAKGLAKIAKDAAALSTEGVSAADAFEKIMLAIETGQSRGLRTLSLFPDLAKAEEVARLQAKLHGETLDENQVKMIRYNAIVEASKNIQGASADAAGTVAGQMKKLSREVKELKENLGHAFQDELKAVVGLLGGFVGWLKDHPDLMAKFLQGTMALVAVMATITAATKAWALAQSALNLAMAANPVLLLATGAVLAGGIIYKEYSDMRDSMERRAQDMQDEATRRDLFSGKLKVDDLRKRGMTDDQIRTFISHGRWQPGDDLSEFSRALPKIRLAGEPDPEALKLQLEIQKRQRENVEYFRDKAIGSRETTGFAKDVAELNADIAKRTTYVDDMGTHRVPLTKAAWDAVLEYARNKLAAFIKHTGDQNKKALTDYLKDEEELAHRRQEWEAARYQERLKHDVDIAEKNLDHLRDVYAFEEQRAGFERDARLRQLEGVDAVTIQQKVIVEQQKAAIEIDYLQKVHGVKQKLYDLDTRRMLLEEELTLKRLGYQADAITARIAELSGQRQEIRDQADEANNDAIRAARENAANRTAQLVRDHNRQIFESLKQQAGGVFDALLTKSQSVWQAIGNSLKTALLTAIKEVVTSRVAAMLMQLFTGQKVTFAGGGAGPGGSGGILGGLGGLLGIGAVPVFGSTGPIPGGAAGGWGTPPLVPGSAGSGGGWSDGSGSPAGGGGLLSGAGWAGMLTNLKSFFGIGGSVQLAPGVAATWQAATLGQKLSSIGKSNAALMGGALLALDGLRRGGWAGVGETTAGGALIGFKFGGPLGAAIGAVAGFAAGMVRRFIKGAVEKAREKIKNLYGVDISDKAVLQQIVDTAKQAYGGNLDMAIRTQQVRDLIQLYAMSTGQQATGMPAQIHALDLAQTGGSLYQSPGYSNGTALPGLGGLPTIDSIGGGVASGVGPVVIQLDGPATTALLRGEAVQAVVDNPRIVQSAVMTASKSNAGRRELTSLQLSPGLVTS